MEDYCIVSFEGPAFPVQKCTAICRARIFGLMMGSSHHELIKLREEQNPQTSTPSIWIPVIGGRILQILTDRPSSRHFSQVFVCCLKSFWKHESIPKSRNPDLHHLKDASYWVSNSSDSCLMSTKNTDVSLCNHSFTLATLEANQLTTPFAMPFLKKMVKNVCPSCSARFRTAGSKITRSLRLTISGGKLKPCKGRFLSSNCRWAWAVLSTFKP